MAKSIGLVGTLSGKAGNFVFCKGSDGRTIVRPYQPQVYNPKTAGQSSQRAKMILAGLLSSITPSSLLVSMNVGRKVANRSVFVQNILRKAETDLVDGNYQASVLGEDIVFGRGTAPARFRVGNVTLTDEGASVSVTPTISDDMVGMCGVRVVALVADKIGNSQNFKEVSFTDAVFDDNTTSTLVKVPLQSLESGVSFVGIYVIPFDLKADAASQYAGENGLSEGATNLLAATLRTNSSIVKDWGDSHFVEDFIPFVQV